MKFDAFSTTLVWMLPIDAIELLEFSRTGAVCRSAGRKRAPVQPDHTGRSMADAQRNELNVGLFDASSRVYPKHEPCLVNPPLLGCRMRQMNEQWAAFPV